jgi:hypothetical protein
LNAQVYLNVSSESILRPLSHVASKVRANKKIVAELLPFLFLRLVALAESLLH